MMRRSLAALFFVIAAAALSLAAVSWWLQQTVFDPEASTDVAEAVLEDPVIRNQIATIIADQVAEDIGRRPPALRDDLLTWSQWRGGAEVLAQVVADSHARMIGVRDDPVRITGHQLVQIVRDERASELGAVVLPVHEVGAVSTVREVVNWVVPIAGAVGGVALLLALVAHPSRADAVFGLGAFLVFIGVMAVLIGYIIPVTLVPALSDQTWVRAIPEIAKATRTMLFVATFVVIVIGAAMLVGGMMRRRRKTWTTPVNMSRYRDVQQWR